jgi:hypothetical protein
VVDNCIARFGERFVVDTVLLDLVSGCCPSAFGVEAKFVGSL